MAGDNVQQVVRPSKKTGRKQYRSVSGGTLAPGATAVAMAHVRRPHHLRRQSAPAAGAGPSTSRGELAGGFDMYTRGHDIPPAVEDDEPVKKRARPSFALGPMESAVAQSEAPYQPQSVHRSVHVTRLGSGPARARVTAGYVPSARPPGFMTGQMPRPLPSIAEEDPNTTGTDSGGTGDDNLSSTSIVNAAKSTPYNPQSAEAMRELWDIDEQDWDYAAEEVLDEHGETKDEGPATGRKFYMSSDDPMSVFRSLSPAILDTFFDLEGVRPYSDCRTCKFRRAVAGEPSPLTRPKALFRCVSCGVFLECQACCLQRHMFTPLHRIKKWTDAQGFFSNISLQELGQTYQMGHAGMGCHAATGSTEVLVMHTNGIHRVSIQWCECDRGDGDTYWRQAMRMAWYPGSWTRPKTFVTFECLKLFRRQNVIARTNVRDFVTILERMTDALTISVVPDRYKVFGCAARQWAYLNRMARAGLAHTPGGVKTAVWGAAATRCWACPCPGVNLPEGWRDEPENVAFKYRLFLGLDANFRLENRLRKKAECKIYEGLGEGLGFLAPSEHYFKHLASGITEEEAKACTAFAAITQKDTRMDHGLRATGVVGCSCTRHECVRPLGMADLMKGERYISVDYAFWASLLKERLAEVFVTYDIGCQWRINLLGKRYGDVPEELAYAENDRPSINVALPVFHSTCHDEECGSAETCRHKVGAGLTDGEAVERIWAVLNELASATKEMHQDVRHDALEDAIDFYNWMKNLGMGIHLRRKREVAALEQKRQAESFALTSESVSLQDQAAWIAMINDWHEQEHIAPRSRTAPNPYSMAGQKAEVITESGVAAMLLAREKDKLADGDTTHTGIAGFVRMGLQLQKLQIRINEYKASRVADHTDTKAKVEDLRIRFLRKLRDYRPLQSRYMMSAMPDIMAEERARQANVDAEKIKIYLPSDLTPAQRKDLDTAMKAEAAFRRSQMQAALTTVRHRLHLKSHFIRFRHKNWRGQVKYTRSQRVLKELDESISNYRIRYEIGRRALVSLEDAASVNKEFRELTVDDISSKWVTDYDGVAARRLAKVGQSNKHAARNWEVATQPPSLSQQPASQSTTAASQSTTAASQPTTAQTSLPPASQQEQDLYDNFAGDEEWDGAEQRGGSRRIMSWIWTAGDIPTTDQDKYLREAIRIEWSKAYARRERWSEEVILLEEEERRTLQSLRCMESDWLARAWTHQGASVTQRGKRAYAKRQVDVFRRIHANFDMRFSAEDELGVSGKKRKTPPTEPPARPTNVPTASARVPPTPLAATTTD